MIVLDWFKFLITIINRFKEQPASIWDRSNINSQHTTRTRGWPLSPPPCPRACPSVTVTAQQAPHGLTDVCPRWLGQRLPGDERTLALPHCVHPGSGRPQCSPVTTFTPVSPGLARLARSTTGLSGLSPGPGHRAPMVGPGLPALVRPLRLVCSVLCPSGLSSLSVTRNVRVCALICVSPSPQPGSLSPHLNNTFISNRPPFTFLTIYWKLLHAMN